MDATNITSIDIDVDFWGGLQYLLLLYVILASSTYGAISTDYNLMFAGLLLLPFIGILALPIGKAMYTSPATPWQGSAAYIIPQILVAVAGMDFNQFAFLATYEQSFFATLVSNAPRPIATMVANKALPLAENTFLIGGIVMLFLILRQANIGQSLPIIGDDPVQALVHAAIAIGSGSYAFVMLHGGEGLQAEFFVQAFLLMTIMAGTLIATDQGWFDIPVFPITFGSTVGLHQALNVVADGGYYQVYVNEYLYVAPPLNLITAPIVIIDGFILLFFLWGAVERAMNYL